MHRHGRGKCLGMCLVAKPCVSWAMTLQHMCMHHLRFWLKPSRYTCYILGPQEGRKFTHKRLKPPNYCFNYSITFKKTDIVGGASLSAPTLCSTCSLLFGHSSGDLWTASEYASITCRLPHTAIHATGTTKSQAGRQTQIHTHSRHAQTHCSSELLKIPKACSLQNNPSVH